VPASLLLLQSLHLLQYAPALSATLATVATVRAPDLTKLSALCISTNCDADHIDRGCVAV